MRLVNKVSAVTIAVGLLMLSTPAAATVFVFDITGTFTSNFQIDTSRGPDRASDQFGGLFSQISYENRPVVFNGIERTASINLGNGLATTFQLLGSGIPFTQLTGDSLFSGPLDTPIFTPGRYALRNPFFGQSVMVEISQAAAAVPEPASWAMLIAGFGLVGAVARRRRSLAIA